MLCPECQSIDLHGCFYDSTPKEPPLLNHIIIERPLHRIISSSKHCSLCGFFLLAFDGSLKSSTPDGIDDNATLFVGKYPFRQLRTRNKLLYPDGVPLSRESKSLTTIIKEESKDGVIEVQLSQLNIWIALKGDRKAPLGIHPAKINGLEYDLLARIPRPNQVDFTLINSWINICDTRHKVCQSEPRSLSLPSGSEFRLIDVNRYCLTKAPPKARYLALSYVWGTAKQLMLNNQTRSQLFTPGYLEYCLGLPHTISDAMKVCLRLGFRYLWVDALCIRQDSGIDKHAQIAVMDKIYSNASLTLVVASGDAGSGIYGVSSNKPRRQTEVLDLSDLSLSLVPVNAAQHLGSCEWASRGWTLQEQVLSNRMLVFTERLCFFKCGQNLFREDIRLENEIDIVREKASKLEYDKVVTISHGLERQYGTFTNTPSSGQKSWDTCDINLVKAGLEEYNGLVSTYCQRKLSYDSDIINAFIGILKVFTPALGPSLYAMPRRFLYWTLLWYTADPFPLEKRSGLGIPSWSWAAWKPIQSQFCFSEYRAASATTMVQFYTYNETENLQIVEQKLFEDMNPFDFIDEKLIPHFGVATSSDFRPEVRKALSTPYHKYILFWTSMAYLDVERERSGPEPNEYKVRCGIKSSKGTRLYLNPEWRATQPDRLPFIVISHGQSIDRYVRCMLVQIDNGVSRRIQVHNIGINQTEWLKASPERTFVVLG